MPQSQYWKCHGSIRPQTFSIFVTRYLPNSRLLISTSGQLKEKMRLLRQEKKRGPSSVRIYYSGLCTSDDTFIMDSQQVWIFWNVHVWKKKIGWKIIGLCLGACRGFWCGELLFLTQYYLRKSRSGEKSGPIHPWVWMTLRVGVYQQMSYYFLSTVASWRWSLSNYRTQRRI
jgi:hypothetical protein